jgi:hypothetical protein
MNTITPNHTEMIAHDTFSRQTQPSAMKIEGGSSQYNGRN